MLQGKLSNLREQQYPVTHSWARKYLIFLWETGSCSGLIVQQSKPRFLQVFWGRKEKACPVGCRITRVHLLHSVCSGLDVRIPFLWDILEGGDASCSWCPPFYLLLSPAPFLDRRYVGWRTRVIAESTACLKMSQFFTRLTKKKEPTSKTWNTPTCSILTSIFKYSRQNVPLFRGNEQPKIPAKWSAKYSFFGHI